MEEEEEHGEKDEEEGRATGGGSTNRLWSLKVFGSILPVLFLFLLVFVLLLCVLLPHSPKPIVGIVTYGPSSRHHAVFMYHKRL